MADEEVVVEEAVEEKDSSRRKYRDDEWTDEQVQARKEELTREEVPEGWVKLADVSNACREKTIAVSKLVRATGGDRCMNDPVDPIFTVIYVGRTRYMAPEVLTTGLEMLADKEFMPSKRRGRKKSDETAEGEAEEAPAKKTTRRKKATVKRPAPESE